MNTPKSILKTSAKPVASSVGKTVKKEPVKSVVENKVHHSPEFVEKLMAKITSQVNL